MHPEHEEYLRNYNRLISSYNTLSRKNSELKKNNTCLLTKIKCNKRVLEENRIRAYHTFQNQNDREKNFQKKIETLTCLLNIREREGEELEHTLRTISEENVKYKTYIKMIIDKMYQLEEKERIENALESNSNDCESRTNDVMNLMDVCSNYELILETFENKIMAITNYSQNLLSKQLNQEQVLSKEKDNKISEMENKLVRLTEKLNKEQQLSIENNSKICKMETELISLTNSLNNEQESSKNKDSTINVMKFDINDLLKRYQLLRDEFCNKKMEHNAIVSQLESKICSIEKELKELNILNVICNKKCDSLTTQNAKLITENDNKCMIINNNVKEILRLESIIVNLKNYTKESDDLIAELKTKICFDEQNSNKENCNSAKTQTDLYQNEVAPKCECTECQTEITIKQLLNKESEHVELLSNHHKLLSEISRLSSENSESCTIISNLKGNIQELKNENTKLIESIKDKNENCLKQLINCGIQANLCSVNCQSITTTSSDKRHCNSSSIDQCIQNNSYCCCLVETKSTIKSDFALEKEELENKCKLLLEENDVAHKTCMDTERKYYNLEREMKKTLDEMKTQYENKLDEFNAQMETYETTFLVNKRDFDTYKKQENELKATILEQKKVIKELEKSLRYEENKVVSLSNNLKNSEKQIESVKKDSTSEKFKISQLEENIETLTELLAIQINKVDAFEQQLTLPKKRKLSNAKSNLIMKSNYSKTQPEKSGDSADVGGTISASELVYSQSLSSDSKNDANRSINNYTNQKWVRQMEMSAGGESANIPNISGYNFSKKLIKKLNFQLDTALATTTKRTNDNNGCGKFISDSMLQQRFTNLSIINIERDLANDIVPDEILNTSANTDIDYV